MSLTQTNNLRESELTERIARFFRLDEEVSGVFRGVYTKTNNEWSMLRSIITLNDSRTQTEVEPCQYRYPDYRFICQSISGLTLTELLSSLNGNADVPIPGIPSFGKPESRP